MRRPLLPLLVLVPMLSLPPAVAAGEEEGGARTRFAVRIGTPYARLSGEATLPDGVRTRFGGQFGFIFGAGVEIPIGPRLALLPEAAIVGRFTSLKALAHGDGSSKLRGSYLEMPVYVKWFPSRASRTSLVLGAVPALRLSASREVRGPGELRDEPASDTLAAWDWALGIGAGIELAETFAALTLDLRYLHGLTDAVEGDDARSRWRALQMTLGVAF